MINYPQFLHPNLTWEHFELLESTNSYLLQSEQPVNKLVSATAQTGGRGRRSKRWVDGGCSLLFSLSTSFPPDVDVSPWPIQAAITLVKSLQQVQSTSVQIKWPNDLYILDEYQQWGKCAGILAESAIGKQAKMVTGVGLNIAPITGIAADYPIGYFSSRVDRNELLIFLVNELYNSWCHFIIRPEINPHDFVAVDYLRNKTFVAEDVYSKESQRGIGIGIDRHGHYQMHNGLTMVSLASQQHIKDIK